MKTLVSRLTAIGIALFVCLGVFAPTSAQASEVLQPSTATVEYGYRYTPEGQLTAVHLYVTGAAADTTAGFSVTGCDAETTGTAVSGQNGDFELVLDVTHMQRSLGPQIPASVTLAAPGYEDFAVNEAIAHPFPHVGEANCAPAVTPNPTKPKATAKVRYTGGKIYDGGAYARLFFTAKRVQPNTKIVVKAFASCGAKKAFASTTKRKGGKFSVFGKSRGFDKRSYYYTVRITKPGKKANFIVTRPSCHTQR